MSDASPVFTDAPPGPSRLSVGLSAVIVAVTGDDPKVLAISRAAGPRGMNGAAHEALPSGPLEPEHRTLEAGLRNWVGRQTHQELGYVEQLYTFGDRDRRETDGEGAEQALSLAYLALVREARPAGDAEAAWQSWYRYFPWEDWRDGRPKVLDALEPGLRAWAARAPGALGTVRSERLSLVFGLGQKGGGWDAERVLERYELLYEAGMVQEALRERAAGGRSHPGRARRAAGAAERTPGRDRANSAEACDSGFATLPGVAMALDHRRMLALAIGRLRGKIKYRPVVFELMPPAFTLGQLQRTVEALAGIRLHKQNFRRLVEQQRLVEETGEATAETGGRPARLVRFRREVLLERPAPGVRLPAAGRR